MITAIMLPPWLMNLHDLFLLMNADRVLFDDLATFSRKSRVHRAKIRTPDGNQWLHIPIQKSDKKAKLKDVRIDDSTNWMEAHLKALRYNYRNSLYFDFYEPEIVADYEEAYRQVYLIDATRIMFHRLLRYLEIEDISFEYMSESDIKMDEIFSENKVWYEQNSKNYIHQVIEESPKPFKHPTYRQHFENFEYDCCLYDLLFQYGPECFRVVDELV